jgi:hypothetical protein
MGRMKRFFDVLTVAAVVILPASADGGDAGAGSTNRMAIVDLNTPRAFPEIESRAQWRQRAKAIREQILVSCGLWPLPQKTPLRAEVFGKLERDGYSVEKVYFQTYPGFYLAGNLYRPLGQGQGPFPGVLNPHGHWPDGRFADSARDGSVPARCISFARQGLVAFAYDMVGFNDTHFPDSLVPQTRAPRPFYQVHRQFGTNRTDELWSISLMGLQTWNSIRALDFLASLPDVDKRRLACTGASGGGTQTFMLGAVDDRLAAQAPVCMVSHTMQGGCSCENAPGLRVQYSNMEIAAAPAPRPQILVAATGDWTKTMLEVEGPAVKRIYDLFGAGERLRYVRFDFGHNYNQTSREAVYAWFGQWLRRHPDAASFKERPYQKEPDAVLRVFPDGTLPADALPMDRFIESLKAGHREHWRALVPRDRASFQRFRRTLWPAWTHTLQLEWPPSGELPPRSRASAKADPTVIVATVANDSALASMLKTTQNGRPGKVQLLTVPLSGEPADPFANFFTTYNRTELQRGVGRLVAQCRSARQARKNAPVILCATGGVGPWALLAAPAADAVVADANQVAAASDEALLAPDLFCPGLRNIGTFEGAAMLAAPHPLLLHNVGDQFPTDALRATYRALGAADKLRVETRRLSEEEIAAWIAALRF